MKILDLQKLTTCRDILSNNIIILWKESLNQPQNDSISYEFIAALIQNAEKSGFQGNLLRTHLIHLLGQGDNLVAKTSERNNGKIGNSLYQAFCEDMEIIFTWLSTKPSSILPTKLLDDYQPSMPSAPSPCMLLEKNIANISSGKELADLLLKHYQQYGRGDIASHKAFRWDSSSHKLIGISHFEAIYLKDLIGYERQKEMLIGNTEAFIAGKPANNVLLVGARGTGKSSSVKALANAYYEQGLRILQATKAQLTDLPKIMDTLRQISSKKFIIFLDDLSFEEYEVEYKYLKSAIEGGVEGRPENVLIYATSNRRHLIKETWKDRHDEQDELYRNDSVNETMSLSDRFGIILNYIAPNQTEYLAIIDTRLKREGIELDAEELRIQALRWEITHSGRSGRIAQQFVDHYLGTQNAH